MKEEDKDRESGSRRNVRGWAFGGLYLILCASLRVVPLDPIFAHAGAVGMRDPVTFVMLFATIFCLLGMGAAWTLFGLYRSNQSVWKRIVSAVMTGVCGLLVIWWLTILSLALFVGYRGGYD